MIVLLYQVRKYFNAKSLGHQTVLDDLAKDGMVLLGLTTTYTWITWIKLTSQYNYYVVMAILQIGVFFRVSLVLQTLTFMVTRYLFVFHFECINSLSERKIKRISRICIILLSIVSAIFDDLNMGKKFLYLTKDRIVKDQDTKEPIPLFGIIIGITTTITIIFVHARITFVKWKYPEFQKQKAENDTFNLKVISVVVGIFIVMVIIVFIYGYSKFLLLTSLLTLLCVRVIIVLMILLLIYSNERMFIFVKKNLMPFQADPFITHFDSVSNGEAPIQEPTQMHEEDDSNDIDSIVISQPTPNDTECVEILIVSQSLQVTNIFHPQALSLPDVWI